ncbi:hypothetical protein MAPG_09577 [Magnaporthiopsis poae ATCC 64411]|uniref:Uncharacterized protein n=1 Tax=Magnaporthiopsis poae (strain ATCC 64411 / 73-15) TaxID=644358 RepID=A0A0C4EAB3_MAGP6|nr:hypothetical protein MAPG_09577 [Magnaporthiopsis poae ATCC 64411]
MGLGKEIAVCQRHSRDVDDGRQKRRNCVPLCPSASHGADEVISRKPLARMPSWCLSREKLHIAKAGNTSDATPPLLPQWLAFQAVMGGLTRNGAVREEGWYYTSDDSDWEMLRSLFYMGKRHPVFPEAGFAVVHVCVVTMTRQDLTAPSRGGPSFKDGFLVSERICSARLYTYKRVSSMCVDKTGGLTGEQLLFVNVPRFELDI